MARTGMTDDEIADELGIDRSTLYRWKKSHKPFCDALKKGKQTPDEKVVASLFERAIGYEYEEVKTVHEGTKLVKVERTTKFVNADVTACIFWLKNRKPEEWRDKRDHEISGEIKGALVIDRG
jgi:transposase